MKTFLVLALVLSGSAASAQAKASQTRSLALEAERGPRSGATVLVGHVLTPEGRPAAGAVVVTSAGGQAVTGADGSFELAVELPLE